MARPKPKTVKVDDSAPDLVNAPEEQPEAFDLPEEGEEAIEAPEEQPEVSEQADEEWAEGVAQRSERLAEVLEQLAEAPRAERSTVKPARAVPQKAAPAYVAPLIELGAELTGSLLAPVRLRGADLSPEGLVVHLLSHGLIEAGSALLSELIKVGAQRGAKQLHAALLRAGASVERAA